MQAVVCEVFGACTVHAGIPCKPKHQLRTYFPLRHTHTCTSLQAVEQCTSQHTTKLHVGVRRVHLVECQRMQAYKASNRAASTG